MAAEVPVVRHGIPHVHGFRFLPDVALTCSGELLLKRPKGAESCTPLRSQESTKQQRKSAAHAQDTQLGFISGGTDLIGPMKNRAARPERPLDINHLPNGLGSKRCRTGRPDWVLAHTSDVAADIDVRRFPCIAAALLLSPARRIQPLGKRAGF